MKSKPLRSFSRGLAVLAALSRLGSATALALARETGLPRATVYRLIETLLEEGYVGRQTADERFHLHLKVRELSEGFEDEHWISAIAGPVLTEVTRQTSWPCDVSTLQGLSMVIHETTHRIAPLSIDRNMVGQELPILGSATGLAYIAFVPSAERATLLDLLVRSGRPLDALARETAEANRLIAATKRRGYGLRHGGQIWPHTGSLALPIRAGSRVLGCINTVWIARALSAREGVEQCLPSLRAARDQIEKQLQSK